MAKYDDEQWDQARALYLSGESLSSVEEATGITLASLKQKAKKERWSQAVIAKSQGDPDKVEELLARGGEVAKTVSDALLEVGVSQTPEFGELMLLPKEEQGKVYKQLMREASLRLPLALRLMDDATFIKSAEKISTLNKVAMWSFDLQDKTTGPSTVVNVGVLGGGLPPKVSIS